MLLLFFNCNPDKKEINNAKDVNPSEANTEINQEQQNQDSAADAVENEPSEDKIHALKVAYFTEELNLSTEEAEKFWPIYNKHNEIYESLRDTEWDAIKKGLREVDTYTDEDAEVLLSRYKNYLNQRLENRLAFINELNDVISSKKIMQLKHAEYNFNKKLLKQYRSKEATKK